jgi:hypothetical protein
VLGALLHLGFHAVVQVSNDIRDQVVAVGGGQHLGVQILVDYCRRFRQHADDLLASK